MRIKKIFINGYKNLKNFECEFNTESSITAFIGDNGSGKSNMLEAVIQAFSYAKQRTGRKTNVKLEYDIQIDYLLDQKEYSLQNRSGDFVILCNNEPLAVSKYQEALLDSIFIYYAGETRRLQNSAEPYIKQQYDEIIKSSSSVDFPYLCYFDLSDLDIAFLSSYVYHNNAYKQVKEYWGYETEAQMFIKLKRPKWASKEGVAANFWGAKRDGFIASFLEQIRQRARNTIDAVDDSYVMAIDIPVLKELSENESDLFIKLKALRIAGILDSVFNFVIKNDKYSKQAFPVAINDFSEGEKQLALLRLILSLTKSSKSLYVLDEADAYLHPNWQRDFVDMINNIKVDGQIFFATHSPLSISRMKRENIVEMKNGKAFSPSVPTYNRDAAELLQEVMNVTLRPSKIEDMIKDFRNAVAHGSKSNALVIYEELQKHLHEEDPFHVAARICFSRMSD